jgi:hypothetical protein
MTSFAVAIAESMGLAIADVSTLFGRMLITILLVRFSKICDVFMILCWNSTPEKINKSQPRQAREITPAVRQWFRPELKTLVATKFNENRKSSDTANGLPEIDCSHREHEAKIKTERSTHSNQSYFASGSSDLGHC